MTDEYLKDIQAKADAYDAKPIPQWAGSMVSNYRTACNVPATISDRKLFDMIEECSGMEEIDVLATIREELGAA